jgi:hypothetical protein
MMDPEEEEVLLQARLAKVQEAKREKQQMRDSMQRVVASPHWTFMVTECANNWSDVACFARFVQDEIARGTLKRGDELVLDNHPTGTATTTTTTTTTTTSATIDYLLN